MKINEMKNQKLFREIINSLPGATYIVIDTPISICKSIGMIVQMRMN